MTKETRQSTTEQLRAVNRDERTVDIVASTFDLDSYGTRIDPAGWDLSVFTRNPVIPLQHDDRGYTGSNGLPVANAIPESIRVEGGKLLMKLRFPTEGAFPLADTVFSLVSDGFLRGVSVGFEPIEWEDTEEDEAGTKRNVRVYRKQRLLEVSLVTIPSNDKALVQRAADLKADVTKIRTMTEQVEHFLDEEQEEAKAAETIKQYRPSHLLKCVSYFDNKQPANRAATKVLEKFYKRILEETPPEDEAKAWDRMGEAVEALEEKEPETKDEGEIPVEESVTATVETTVTIEPPTPPPAEAPQDARKASVQIPMDQLPNLMRSISEACAESVVKASRQGIPRSEWAATIDAAGHSIERAFIPNSLQ